MILGTPLNESNLFSLMQRSSTKVHKLMSEIIAMNDQLNEISDTDLEAMFVTTVDAGATERAAFRNWQVAMKALADNYKGNGAVLNRQFEIGKRVVPTL